jgi:hypothetical protein
MISMKTPGGPGHWATVERIKDVNGMYSNQSCARGPALDLRLHKPHCMFIMSMHHCDVSGNLIWAKLLMHRSFTNYLNMSDFQSEAGLRGGRWCASGNAG